MSAVAAITAAAGDGGDIYGIVATADRIASWAEVAKAGDVFIYASVVRLPIGSPGAAMARALEGRELVTLAQRNIPGRAERNYVAQRTTTKWSDVSGRGEMVPVRRGDRALSDMAAMDELLPLLTRAAHYGRPCPTDAQLATRTMLSIGEVHGALLALMEAGAIRVMKVKAPTLRVVIICATGARTGMVR